MAKRKRASGSKEKKNAYLRKWRKDNAAHYKKYMKAWYKKYGR